MLLKKSEISTSSLLFAMSLALILLLPLLILVIFHLYPLSLFPRRVLSTQHTLNK